MSDNTLAADVGVTSSLTAYTWTPQPEGANLVQSLLAECQRDCPFAANLAKRMLDSTGTRLVDWVDHFALPAHHPAISKLPAAGYVQTGLPGLEAWEQPAGLLPRIRVTAGPHRQLAIKVESVVDFLAAQRLSKMRIVGEPWASVRKAMVASDNSVEIWIVERHGSLAFDANAHETVAVPELLQHTEAFRLRRRDYAMAKAFCCQSLKALEQVALHRGE